MRVLIDTTAVRYPHSGTGVYVQRLAEALGPVGVEVVEPPQRPRGRPGGEGARRNLVRSARNLTLDRGWLRDGLPAAAEAAGADVIHHPLPAWCPHSGHAQVVTVHDVAYEALRGHFDPFWRRIARREHQRAVQSADAV
ncbi:MAG: hypothetical protein H0T15_09220, partial [Thermoleophilaceae bacterium]|nr:hypothetical protein [Thermoleophilaceae bacterium]